MRGGIAAAALLVPIAAAQALAPEDFASGIDLVAAAPQPLLQLSLPDPVYGGVTRADLADLRVFNAQGTAVPHALCAAATTLPGAAPRVVDRNLPVFSLRGAQEAAGTADVDVQVRGAQHADVRVQVQADAAPAPGATRLSGYVIDARAAQGSIRALRLRWQTADGASAVAVRVEASDDLDRWRTIVAQTTLLRVDNAGSTLERMRVPLPQASYNYLRLVRADAGAAPAVDGVVAETVRTTAPEEAPFTWFEAQVQAGANPFAYDAARRAPVQIARLELPRPNMAVHARLQSRGSAAAQWTTHWQGEVFDVGGDDLVRRNRDIRFAAVSDPWWRVEITDGAESLDAEPPTLRLGYRPQQLRFLAQGDGPYVLAYGSVRAEPARRRGCDSLLGPLSNTELAALTGAAQPGTPRVLGGKSALKLPAAPLPWRQIALWGVLVAAALLLIAMARSLLRRARG